MDSNQHIKIVTVRHSTPSRRAIILIVAQVRDELGDWQVPTITFEGPVILILESGRYARDLAFALTVASYFYDEMMTYVSNDGARKMFEDEAN